MKLGRKNITLIIFIMGLIHWYLFINYGRVKLNFGDWPLGHQIFDVFKQSLLNLDH